MKATGRRAVLIAGPTASGKSAAALFLARALGGAIVNADSMQVYRDLRLLTARPSPEDEARARHVLYGHVDGAEGYSAGRWLAEARAAAEEIWEAGGVPLFTGGTGLYFRVLEVGLAEAPAIPGEIRRKVRDLAARDPGALRAAAEAEGLDGRLDRQRLARALEVKLATGRRLEDFHARGQRGALDGAEVLRVFIAPPRALLRERIAARFRHMLEAGAAEEVARLMARRLEGEPPVTRAVGVPQIAAALRGEISMEAAADRAIAATRQYAKRQMTWARKYMAGWRWLEDAEAAAQAVARLAAGGK